MEALAIIGTFGSIVTFIFFFFTTRHKERMALIESGKSATIFDKKRDNTNSALKYGLLLLSAGIGFLLGFIFVDVLRFDESIIPACLFISGGLGLITYYRISNDQEERASMMNYSEE